MKVFLRYSPRSSRDNAMLIYNTIRKMGHTHVSDYIEKMDIDSFYQSSETEWIQRYERHTKEMDEADICIFEASISSTGVGQLAQMSVSKFKPTILLYLKGNRPYFFEGMAGTEKRVQLLEYNPDNIEEVLKYAFDFAKDFLETRFTLLLPPDIMAFLNKLKKQGKSRSEFIRNLIRKEMNK